MLYRGPDVLLASLLISTDIGKVDDVLPASKSGLESELMSAIVMAEKGDVEAKVGSGLKVPFPFPSNMRRSKPVSTKSKLPSPFRSPTVNVKSSAEYVTGFAKVPS